MNAPRACPRCGRPRAAWTIDEASDRAGCVCGEVFRVGEPGKLIVAPAAAKLPSWWKQSVSATRWSGKVAFMPWRIAVPLLILLPLAAARALRFAAYFDSWAWGVALATGFYALLGVLAYFALRNETRFDIEGGRLRVTSKRGSFDIACDEIAHVEARNVPSRLLAAPHVVLCVHERSGKVNEIPVARMADEHARAIAQRIERALDETGRTLAVDYRGEPLRIAEPAESLGAVDVEDESSPTRSRQRGE